MPKVLVVIPEDLLKELDTARGSQANRSAFICHSLRSQLRLERMRQLRRRILDDARAIAKDFHKYWSADDEPMWMAAENEALMRAEEKGVDYGPRPARRRVPCAARSDRRKRTSGGATRPRRPK